ncbi:integrin beta-1-A-like [Dysidea avara]|uniref:integrin beta-1-A-like n=1 Tax=Dysidea avara TaxID=196820 RepID=UPI0033293E46
MLVKLASLFVISVYIGCGSAQNICASAETCDDCLRTAPDCVWCSQIYTDRPTRCFHETDNKGNCSNSELVDAVGSVSFIRNDSVNSQVLVSPQQVKIKLRLGSPESFNIQVNRVRNAPLDLYFVMDQSLSMEGSLNTFKTVTNTLLTHIASNITNNYRVGMGLFVDKPIAPYISETQLSFDDPCRRGCRPAYGFRHIVPLTSDSNVFQETLNNQTISGNLDTPEGGMDAVLQAILCEEIIGWRPPSLKMLMHISDAPIHVAGDGKLAGIVYPPVRDCLLQPESESNAYFYNGTITYDYPSLGMIESLLRERNIQLVFGALLDSGIILEDMREQLPDAIILQLSANSSDIVDIVERAYREITDDITLQINEPEGIDVTFVPNCPNTDGKSCLNVEFDQMVEFNVTVTAATCDAAFVSNGGNFSINIDGFGSVMVDFQGICECDCTSNAVPNSDDCSGSGTLSCGACQCQAGNFGSKCECDATAAMTMSNNCPMGPNEQVCSGIDRGNCQCDECICTDPRYFGEACECDQFSCETDSNGNVCGGLSQGNCGCNGTCVCINGWTRSACDCTPDQSACRDTNNLICSNRGACECNECICNDAIFTGQFCQFCTGTGADCPEPACLAFGDCILSEFGSSGSLDYSDPVCSGINITQLDMSQRANFDRTDFMIDGSTRTVSCVASQGNCAYRYFVGTRSEEGGQVPIVYERQSCSEDSEFPAWIIIVIILGALLLIGILVLIGIRIFMELRYRYEYQQWLKEKNDAKFGQQLNPIYSKATTDVDNPLYDQKKRKQKEAESAAQ